MRYPKFLKNNGTIGFVAPSFGCATEPYISLFKNAQKKFEALGYSMYFGPNVYEDKGIGISNLPPLCGKELNDVYVNDDVDAIISCGGGELMCEVVPYIDFNLVKKSDPKWYMGYSDNTNFTFLSATISDTAAIYGPCVSSFGMEPWHESINDALDLITGKNLTVSGYDMWEKEDELPEVLPEDEDPLTPYRPNRKTEYKFFIPDKGSSQYDGNDLLPVNSEEIQLEGRLLGGCLDCLVNLAGTEFDHVDAFNEKYKDDGIIWFLESCDLNVMSIRRSIWLLKHTGWFKYSKGFLIGRPLHFEEDMMGLDQYTAVTELLKEFHVPILMDLDIGHLPPMMPLIEGSCAKITAINNTIKIEHVLR